MWFASLISHKSSRMRDIHNAHFGFGSLNPMGVVDQGLRFEAAAKRMGTCLFRLVFGSVLVRGVL